jgi:hypothetical protein
MITWTRATERERVCGGCNTPIERGASIRVTEITGITRKFIRCWECATAAIPPEILMSEVSENTCEKATK